MNKLLFVLSTIFLFSACGTKENANEKAQDKIELSPSEEYIQSIEKAHYAERYYAKEVVQFDLDLTFGGKKRFNGTIQMTPSGGLVKMIDSSKTLIWDGNEAYTSDSLYTRARFGLLTWSYFFAAPYKLGDPGSNLELLGIKNLNDLEFKAAKLTFGEGVGDTPDDWYITYKSQESNLLAGMAYIVTGSSTVEEAEKDPHAITYEAFDVVDEIPFATQWNFWTWNSAGELNKLLGSAIVSNIKFIEKEENLFKPSSQFVISGRPSS